MGCAGLQKPVCLSWLRAVAASLALYLVISPLAQAFDIALFQAELLDAETRSSAPRSVLFVGNSYTAGNWLPNLFEDIAASHPDSMEQYLAARFTRGGAQLPELAKDPKLLTALQEVPWDFVVIQGHSRMALFEHRRSAFRDALNKIRAQIAENETGLVMFATWPRRADHQIYQTPIARTFKPPSSPEGMNKAIETAYRASAGRANAIIAPIGRCWLRVPEAINLYQADGSHPTLGGSYLAALVLFGTITGLSPAKTDYIPEGLSAQAAETLKTVADTCARGGP